MAVYSWIYANARKKGDAGDYLVRRCDPGLEAYRSVLKSISRRMLSTEKRYGAAERQRCWFSGFLDGAVYVVAVAGEQEELLGTPFAGGAFRRQYCVLALGFTGKDIRLYRRGDALFEPLKRELRAIQGVDGGAADAGSAVESTFPAALPPAEKKDAADAENAAGRYNIVQSSRTMDERFWEESFQRPAATGLLCVEDAKKMLDLFPRGVTTVTEDVKMRYRAGGAGESLKEQMERETAEEEERKREQAALRQRTEEMRAKIRAGEEDAGLPGRRWNVSVWVLAGAAALILSLLSMILN